MFWTKLEIAAVVALNVVAWLFVAALIVVCVAAVGTGKAVASAARILAGRLDHAPRRSSARTISHA